MLQEYAARDQRIRIVQNDRNRHVCYTGNRSIGMATGDLVTLIFCDDMLAPNKVRSDQEFFHMAEGPNRRTGFGIVTIFH